MRFVACLLLVWCLPGCSLFEADGGTVTAQADTDRVTVTNNTEARIYYFVIGSGRVAVTEWVPHLDSKKSIAPGQSKVVPNARIPQDGGYETKLAVIWWYASDILRGGLHRLKGFSVERQQWEFVTPLAAGAALRARNSQIR